MTNLAFKALLKSKGYNREKLAEELKLSGNSVGRKYTGKIPWTWPEACKVCAALGITLDEFAAYFPAAAVRRSIPVKPKSDREQLADALETAVSILRGAAR